MLLCADGSSYRTYYSTGCYVGNRHDLSDVVVGVKRGNSHNRKNIHIFSKYFVKSGVNEFCKKKCNASRNNTDEHSLDKERDSDEGVGCTDVSHNVYFFSS